MTEPYCYRNPYCLQHVFRRTLVSAVPRTSDVSLMKEASQSSSQYPHALNYVSYIPILLKSLPTVTA